MSGRMNNLTLAPREHFLYFVVSLIHIALLAFGFRDIYHGSAISPSDYLQIAAPYVALVALAYVKIILKRQLERTLLEKSRNMIFRQYYGSDKLDEPPSECGFILSTTLETSISSYLGMISGVSSGVLLMGALVYGTTAFPVFTMVLLAMLVMYFSVGAVLAHVFARLDEVKTRLSQEHARHTENVYYGKRELLLYRKANWYLEKVHNNILQSSQYFLARRRLQLASSLIRRTLVYVMPLIAIYYNSQGIGDAVHLLQIIFVIGITLDEIQNLFSNWAIMGVARQKLRAFKENHSNRVERKCYLDCLTLRGTTKDRPATREGLITIRKGDRVLVRGPVGSGKTTLLRGIAMGKAQFPESLDASKVSGNVLYIPESIGLFPGSVLDNILINKAMNRTEVVEMGSRFGFNQSDLHRNISRKDVSEISGGEKKIIGFLRFYFNRREYNILDEIFAECDRATINTMQNILSDISEAVIVISHYNVNAFQDYRVLEFTDEGLCHEI